MDSNGLDLFVNMGCEKYPKNIDNFIEYGTAGFRAKNEILDHVVYRMGALAVLRSKKKNAAIGLMITASHNPEVDNGVKLVDPSGEMLEESWESIATRLANISNEYLRETLLDIISSEDIDLKRPASVLVGQDTRASSERLAKAAVDSIQSLAAKVFDYGVVTTPMLHYFVVCKNTSGAYGVGDEAGYYDKLSTAFNKLRGQSSINGSYHPVVSFDGANGVGGIKMLELVKYLKNNLTVEVHNSGQGVLNYECGSDYVKVSQKPPKGVPMSPSKRCVSVDGDSDRVVYYYTDSNGQFHLLDGDRIGTLLASYLLELIKESGIHLKLGLVQTAYANGSSTNYISKTLKVPVACVETGVKHLHHKAQDFDIGVYFEANGHGTVLYSEHAQRVISAATEQEDISPRERAGAKRLLDFIDLTNQTVGDALADFLLVETVLHARGWSIVDWENMYTDLPNRLMKVSIRDRNLIETTDAARRCTNPPELQTRIDILTSRVPDGRSFVRPSGTEDVVRVYAEAATKEEADKLALLVSSAVYELCEGVGSPPLLPN